jgi:hypothetical protein
MQGSWPERPSTKAKSAKMLRNSNQPVGKAAMTALRPLVSYLTNLRGRARLV